MLIPVPDRKAETLLAIIQRYVHPGSNINTDCFKSYNNLHLLFASHNTVNHSLFFVDPETGIHTNTIEGNWKGVKENVPIRSRTACLIPIHLVKVMINRLNPESPLDYLLNFLL